MDLYFNRDGILKRGKGLTFDDVLLVPNHSTITSRRTPKLQTKVTKNFSLDMPLISANMDTITELDMAMALFNLGGLGILHRFLPLELQIEQVGLLKKQQKDSNSTLPISASIGVKEDGIKRANALAEAGVDILTIDIAHGDSILMLETLDYVKKNFPKTDVIAGNIATANACKRLIDSGADAVKVGIGPGSMCTTRIITGHGVPQLTAIAACVQEAQKHDIPVIADGGIRNSGDIVKCLASGASTVMLGSMLSGTLETPGEVKGGFKAYRGMASQSAQVSWRGELPEGMAAEGEATKVACKGSVANLIHEILGGIRSGMSYLGVDEIQKMPEQAQFIEMTSSGAQESKAHGLKS